MQHVHGEFARSLVRKLGMSLDGVTDEFEALQVGCAERCWRSHHIFLFGRACWLATELPDINDTTLFSASWVSTAAANPPGSIDAPRSWGSGAAIDGPLA